MIEHILLVAWFFLFGAIIGSFLNVVVYRLPQGMSLIFPPSHCPSCKRRIRWFDNIPIVSWFVLRGRCRDCKAAISARYPLVEGISAAMFALLTIVEFTFKGANLPERVIFRSGNLVITAQSNAYLYAILLFHLLLLCTLLAAALVEVDGRRPPLRLFVPALAVGIIAPLVWPHLRPVPAWPSLGDWAVRAADSMASAAAGGFAAYAAWRLQATKLPGGTSLGLLCVGIFLGWQALCGIAILIASFALLALVLRKRRRNADLWPFTLWLYTITFGWILAWSTIVEAIK